MIFWFYDKISSEQAASNIWYIIKKLLNVLTLGMEDGSLDSPYTSTGGAAYKTTIILIDGKKVKLHIWDTSGQGRFCTIIRYVFLYFYVKKFFGNFTNDFFFTSGCATTNFVLISVVLLIWVRTTILATRYTITTTPGNFYDLSRGKLYIRRMR